MLHDQRVSHSQFLPVRVADHHAAGRASSGGRVAVVARSAAGAAVDEEGTPSAHLCGFLGLEVEGAGSLGGLVHDVDALGQLVSGGGERAHVDHALLGWVVEAVAGAGVSVGVNGVVSGPSDKPSGVLVVVVGHW